MKSCICYSLLLLVFTSCLNHETQNPIKQEPSDSIKDKLQRNSQKMIEAAKTKSFTEISHLYDDETMLMAEYNPLIKNRDNIKVYYDSIFNRENVEAYTREIVDVIIFKDRIIEIGLFTKTMDNSETYRGKYFNAWKLQNNDELILRAEAFGYLTPIESPSKLVVKEAAATKIEPIKIPWEFEAYNALEETNVIDRIPEKSANSYTEDAMYLPFADTIKAGKSVLVKHFEKYYENPAKIDSIQVFTFAYDSIADGYIKYGGFYVDWRVPEFSGNTTGTGISYWRREKDNTLRIHRQIGLHIYKE